MTKEENHINQNDEAERDTREPDMGFFDHLGELRTRLFYSVLGLVVACGLSAWKVKFIMDEILLKPAKDTGLILQNIKVFGKPVLYFKVIVMGGFIIASPWIIYQIWKFIEPALYPKEKKWAVGITFSTTFCFLSGVAFAYFVMIPSMLSFSANFETGYIQNNVDINEFWEFVLMMVLVSGLIFEMPVISFILTKVGLLSHSFLKKFRKHAIIVILILAAIITPSPDPFNQMIVAVPIYLLYELSIIVSYLSLKRQVKLTQD